MSVFILKNVGKIQSKIGTPKIDTPKIDTFFKSWAHTKCVNLWRRTVSRIHFKFIFFFANFLWIHYLFYEFTIGSLSFSRNSTQFTLCILHSLRIYYLFRELTLNSRSVSRIHFQFTIFILNSYRIHTPNSLNANSHPICFANSFWIHYLFREFTWFQIKDWNSKNVYIFVTPNPLVRQIFDNTFSITAFISGRWSNGISRINLQLTISLANQL